MELNATFFVKDSYTEFVTTEVSAFYINNIALSSPIKSVEICTWDFDCMFWL